MSGNASSSDGDQMHAQTHALLMQVPAPNFPCAAHVKRHPAVHADPSQLGGTTVQLPPTQEEPLPPHSASVQHAEAQAQVLPCLT